MTKHGDVSIPGPCQAPAESCAKHGRLGRESQK